VEAKEGQLSSQRGGGRRKLKKVTKLFFGNGKPEKRRHSRKEFEKEGERESYTLASIGGSLRVRPELHRVFFKVGERFTPGEKPPPFSNGACGFKLPSKKGFSVADFFF